MQDALQTEMVHLQEKREIAVLAFDVDEIERLDSALVALKVEIMPVVLFCFCSADRNTCRCLASPGSSDRFAN